MDTWLDKTLMLLIMHRVGELSGRTSALTSTGDLRDLVPHLDDADAMFFLNRHLKFLKESGYLRLSEAMQYSETLIYITATGQMFVQPELAEFGNSNLLPDLIKSLEEQIGKLSYPEEQKSGLVFRMREAVVKQAPDLLAKILVEIGTKVITG